MTFHLEAAGPCGLYVIAHAPPGVRLTAQLRALNAVIRQALGPHLIDITQGWDSLLLQYDPQRLDYPTAYYRIEAVLQSFKPDDAEPQDHALPVLTVPIMYDGEDLPDVAHHCGLTVEEVIRRHHQSDFHVGAIGFVPGFAYLGGLDARLDIPRRATPRARVAAGSLAIAAGQSALYPQASPGGWHVIGRCPWTLFDAFRTPAALFTVGQRVRFTPIDEATFNAERGK